MKVILLSGGSGKRLWPLSNDVRSKQFIKLFRREDGELESMVQRMYRMIKQTDENAAVTVATSKTQVSSIRNQLGDDVGISVEPYRRDTFPAIALACAYLKDVQKVNDDEAVVVCPADPYVNGDYFKALSDLSELAQKGEANLVLMGISPTYPSEKFGYIIPENNNPVSAVETFKEKPDTETAEKYIAQGALWNGGVFAFKLGYMTEKSHELIDYTDYSDLYAKYGEVNKISFDYAVAEKESRIQVMRFSGIWTDVGTWSALTDITDNDIIGRGIADASCENVHIVNELDTPVVAFGMKDTVISVGADGILVSDIQQSDKIKPIVDKIGEKIRFAQKSWGDFRVLDMGENTMTAKLTVSAGRSMTYHSHSKRDEIWVVISGEGHAVLDGNETVVKSGDTVSVKAGCRHKITADTTLVLIEIQLGELDEKDKVKYRND